MVLSGRLNAKELEWTLALMLRDKFTNDRDEFPWDFHDGLAVIFEGGFILSHGLCCSLLFIMFKYPPHPLFVPAGWKSIAFHRASRKSPSLSFLQEHESTFFRFFRTEAPALEHDPGYAGVPVSLRIAGASSSV
jgi:hypothetical protein